jgi:hypothetical protein
MMPSNVITIKFSSSFTVAQKRLLFGWKSKTATFRVADTNPPLEEISVVGKGRFKGKVLTSLCTTRVTPTGRARDKEQGMGILWLEGKGRASYRLDGTIGHTHRWREMAKGTITFGERCVGSLEELRNVRAVYETVVNSKGESETKVWHL